MPEGVRAHRGKLQIDFYVSPGERRRKTLDLDDTPANRIKAAKERKKILDRIAAGVFDEAEYFGSPSPSTKTFKEVATVWLANLEGITDQSRSNYESALRNHWYPEIGEKKVRFLKPSEIKTAIVNRKFKSPGYRNLCCIPLRGALHMAHGDGLTESDLSVVVEDLPTTPREPNPFTVEEATAIVEAMRSAKKEVVANLYQLLFFTGMRPGEAIALQWPDIDLKKKTARIHRRRYMGEDIDRTKTGYERTILLNAQAVHALTRQKALTRLKGDDVFLSEKLDAPFYNTDTLRRNHWEPALAAAGLDYRDQYQTRHSYASWMLMAGANLKWTALQLGHSMQELLRTYARWIERADQGPVELGKVESFITGSKSPPQDRPESGTGTSLRAES